MSGKLKFGFNWDRDYFINISIILREVFTPILIFVVHPLAIFVVLKRSSMAAEYKMGYVCHTLLMTCFDIYNGFIYQFYTLAPLPILLCTGILCDGSVEPATLFVILSFFTVAVVVPFLFLMLRMHQRMLFSDSPLKISTRAQTMVMLLITSTLYVNVFGFYRWAVDIPEKEALLATESVAWARNISSSFLVLGGQVGDIGIFKNELILLLFSIVIIFSFYTFLSYHAIYKIGRHISIRFSKTHQAQLRLVYSLSMQVSVAGIFFVSPLVLLFFGLFVYQESWEWNPLLGGVLRFTFLVRKVRPRVHCRLSLALLDALLSLTVDELCDITVANSLVQRDSPRSFQEKTRHCEHILSDNANAMKAIEEKNPNIIENRTFPDEKYIYFVDARSTIFLIAFSVHILAKSCADFYKRTTSANRSFQCRRGDGKCAVKPKDRHNCRGCRFSKCEEFGKKFVPPNTDAPVLDKIPPLIPVKDNLLSLISREHAKSIARRKICESTLKPKALHRHVKADIEGEDLLLCTWTFLMDCYQLCSGDHIHFASACFPEFEALSPEDKQLMFKNYSVRLFNAEIHCDTYRRFGTQDGRFSMATFTTCYDTTNFEFVTEHESPSLNKAIAKSMHHYHFRIARLIGPILRKSAFTETEMNAIFALSIWLIDPNQSLPEHIVSLSRSMRRQVFDALKEYYREELHIENYSVRLGNLITFEHTIQEIPNILGETMQLLSVAGMLEGDAPFLEEFMKLSF